MIDGPEVEIRAASQDGERDAEIEASGLACR